MKSEANYQQQAKQNALSDLVSEIRVEVSGNSLLLPLQLTPLSFSLDGTGGKYPQVRLVWQPCQVQG